MGLPRWWLTARQDQLAKLKDDPQTVVAYDNINFMDRKRDEQAGHGVEQQSFTNAMLVHCDELPETGLTQDMHDPSVPLRLRDIVLSPGIQDSDDVGVRLSRFHIADAIKKVHKDTVDAVFKGSKAFPTFPFSDRLPAKKTLFWQFAGITANEGTIEGTYKVHDDIYLRQLRMNAASHPTGLDDFTSRLYLAHGDQLTVHHIRAVQQEQRRASRAYDRRQWLRGVPAWFHIQMNLLNTLVRTHFAPPVPGQSAVHSILSDSTLWSRSVNTRDGAKYHLTEPIVAQGFSGRVTAMFYAVLQRRGLLSPSVGGRKEDIEEVIKGLSPDDFNSIVDEVQRSTFTKAAWDDTASDIDYRTQCRMLQEVELFLTLRHAVKHGDIGMLRRLVDPLTVVFFGASQHNYGREMLHLRWMLSNANTSTLQRAILGSSLVNWLGQSNTFKPIDLALEHLNCSLKIDLRNFKNSTHDIAIAFQRGALCNTWMRGLKYTMETTYGESMSGKHSRAGVVADMFLLAWQTWVGGYSHPRPASSGDSRAAQFDSIDLYRLGMDVLESRVAQFNQTYVTHVAAPFVLPEPDDDGFVYIDDIHPYASLVSDRYDGVEDLVLDLPRPPVIEDPVTDPIADAARTRQHGGLGDGSDVETIDLS